MQHCGSRLSTPPQPRRRTVCCARKRNDERGELLRLLQSGLLKRYATVIAVSLISQFAVCPGTTVSTLDAAIDVSVWNAAPARVKSAEAASAPAQVTPQGSAHPGATDPLYNTLTPFAPLVAPKDGVRPAGDVGALPLPHARPSLCSAPARRSGRSRATACPACRRLARGPRAAGQGAPGARAPGARARGAGANGEGESRCVRARLRRHTLLRLAGPTHAPRADAERLLKEKEKEK